MKIWKLNLKKKETKNEDKKSKKENKPGFSLLNIIVIVIISSVVSAVTTGVIVTNNYKSKSGFSYNDLLHDENLTEFLNVYSSILSDYYEKIDTKQMLDNAISAMLNYLGDSYTTYLNTDQSKSLAEKLEGSYKGIGVTISDRTIKEVTKNSPAEKAGLQVNDEFISINGADVTSKSSSDIASMIKNNDKVDKVTIVVKRGTEQKTFTIETSSLYVPAITYHMVDGTKIGYIYISIFSNTLTEQVQSALNDLQSQGMEKLIIDVRDDTGGYLSSAEKVASIFMNKDATIYSLENKGGTTIYKDKTEDHTNYPIVILINNQTASASEILTAALIDSYGAKTVGVTSYGKGKVQQTMTLTDGSMAKYTSAKWLRPNGECIDGVGIKPDYQVEMDIKKDEQGNVLSVTDTQLAKAIEILNGN
jgi:carboxyl-terminal processing protease